MPAGFAPRELNDTADHVGWVWNTYSTPRSAKQKRAVGIMTRLMRAAKDSGFTDQELAQVTSARKLNDAGWVLLSLVAAYRTLNAFGYTTLEQAVSEDEGFAVQQIAQSFSELAGERVFDWSSLAVDAQKGAHKVTAKHDLVALAEQYTAGLVGGLKAVLLCQKTVKEVRLKAHKRLSAADEEMLGKLTTSLDELEDVLLHEGKVLEWRAANGKASAGAGRKSKAR